jgi:hypothetical protein
MAVEMMRKFGGRTRQDGTLSLDDRPAWAWLSDQAAVNLVGFHRPELAGVLRSSVVLTALGDACVCPFGLDLATRWVKDCQDSRGSAPTILAATSGHRVEGNGVLDAGRDSVCPGLHRMKAYIGTQNLTPGRIAALERLRDARRESDERGAGQGAARLQRDLQLRRCMDVAAEAAAKAAEVRKRALEARGRPDPAALASQPPAPGGAAEGAALGPPPRLEAARPDGTFVCAARPGPDGRFCTSEVRLQSGGQARDGAFSLRLALYTTDGFPVLRGSSIPP